MRCQEIWKDKELTCGVSALGLSISSPTASSFSFQVVKDNVGMCGQDVWQDIGALLGYSFQFASPFTSLFSFRKMDNFGARTLKFGRLL